MYFCLHLMNIVDTYIELYTDEKEKKIFLKYKDIQKGAVAKSYMKKDFLIYEEMCITHIYEEAVSRI
jgi:hypothetical protein